VQEIGSHNLIVITPELQKITIIEGMGKRVIYSGIASPHCTNEDSESMLWYGGEGFLGLVLLNDLSIIVLSNLLFPRTSPSTTISIHSSIFDSRRGRYLIAYSFDDEEIITYSEQKREPDHHITEEIFSCCKKINCLAIAKNTVYGFYGGISHENGASIGMFVFNKSLEQIACLILPKRECSRFETIETSLLQKNIVLAAGDGQVFVITAESDMRVLNKIRFGNITSSLGLSILNGFVLAANDNEIQELHFEEKKDSLTNIDSPNLENILLRFPSFN